MTASRGLRLEQNRCKVGEPMAENTSSSAVLLSADLKEDLGPIDIQRAQIDGDVLKEAQKRLRELGREQAVLRIINDGQISDYEINL